MSSSSLKFKLYEKYISNPRENIYKFITGKTLLQEEYYSVFSNAPQDISTKPSLNDSLLFDGILILSTMLLSAVLTVIQSIEEYNQTLLIADVVIITLQGVTFIVSLCKRLRDSTKTPFLISWFFFLSLFVQAVLHIIAYSDSHSLRLLHKIYYNIITSHLIMSHLIKINMSMHIGNLIVVCVIDIFICIAINLANKEFYYEICSILVLDVYLVANGFKTEQIQTKVFAKYIKGKITTKEFKDVVSGAMIGVIQCSLSPDADNMDIIQMNKVFESSMGFCVIKSSSPSSELLGKSKNIVLSCSTVPMLNNPCKDANLSQQLLINLNHTNNKSYLNASTPRENHEQPKRNSSTNGADPMLLVSDVLYQKVFDKKGLNASKKIVKGLKESISDYIDSGSEMQCYSHLGKFKCLVNQSLYAVYIKIKHKSKEGSVFNLLVIELTANRYEEKEKIEMIYQGLILSKISNEFKKGIASIINTVNLIKAQYAANNINGQCIDQLNLNKYCSSTSIFAPSGVITISLDMLNRITSLSECILIVIANLVDSVKTKGKDSAVLLDEITNNDGYYNFADLKLFLEEVVRFYIYLFHKKFNVKYEIEEAFFDMKLLTNEVKLKQIIAHVISNAVKHSPNNTDLSVIVSISGLINIDEHDGENNANNTVNIKIIVADQGSGVPLSIYNKINETNSKILAKPTKYVPSNSHSNDVFGKFKEYKMGLSISQKLSKEIGAVLSCEYVKGQDIASSIIHGTRFILQFTTSYKKNSIALKQTIKSPNYNNPQGAILISRSFKNQLYKKKKRITQTNGNDDSHGSVFFSDGLVSCISPSEDYDITSVISNNHLNYQLKNSSIHSPRNSSLYSKKSYNLEKSKALFKTPKLSRKSFIFVSPVNSMKQAPNSPSLMLKNKNSLYKKRKEPIESNKKCNSKTTFMLMATGKEQSICQSRHSNSLLMKRNSNKSFALIGTNEVKVIIVDECIEHRSSIDLMVRKLCQSRNVFCSIAKFEDGADALYELNKELNTYDKLETKLILCGEKMRFVNGLQLFTVMKQSSIRIPSLSIPFVLYSSDSSPLKSRMKEIGMELVFDRPLAEEDIEHIFHLKCIWPCGISVM